MTRKYFGTDGIRGTVGTAPITPDFVLRLGYAAGKVLAALENLATDTAFLVGPALSLADLHLGAMLAYFVQAREGEAMLQEHARLAAWWRHLRQRPSFGATDPGLP